MHRPGGFAADLCEVRQFTGAERAGRQQVNPAVTPVWHLAAQSSIDPDPDPAGQIPGQCNNAMLFTTIMAR